jgi:hypothetical protein
MCRDKQDLFSVKFHLNGYEFQIIFVADRFQFALLFTFYCSVVRVSACQKYTCVTVCNVTCLITYMWSICFVLETGRILERTYTYWKSWAVSSSCQPLCYTYRSFCSSWQSQFQNCSTETWSNILWYGGEHGECYLFVCVHRKKEINILWYAANWLTDWQEAFCIHNLKRLHAMLMDRLMDVVTV